MNRDHRQVYSLHDGRLCHLDAPISAPTVAHARTILHAHTIPKFDARHCAIALYFCIASQYSTYERPVAFARALHNATLDQLFDDATLRERAVAAKLLFTDRFAASISYTRAYPGGIEQLAQDYLDRPMETRRILVEHVNYLSMKTASFWHLCLGGTSLMTLDRHNYRQIAGLGVHVDKGLSHGTRRTDGRVIPLSARPAAYERIERETVHVLRDEPLLQRDQNVDSALATALFWTTGALFSRRKDPRQRLLFDDVQKLPFTSPFLTDHPSE